MEAGRVQYDVGSSTKQEYGSVKETESLRLCLGIWRGGL